MRVNDLGEHSDWLYQTAANQLFSLAKERVFIPKKKKRPSKKKRASDGSEQPASSENAYDLVLEENPKWQVLREVLDEIFAEIQATGESAGRFRVLVLASDQPTCGLLRDYLLEGGKNLLKRKWSQYLERKSYLRKNKWYGRSKKSRGPTKKATGTRRRKDSSQRSILDMIKRVPKQEDSQSSQDDGEESSTQDTKEEDSVTDFSDESAEVSETQSQVSEVSDLTEVSESQVSIEENEPITIEEEEDEPIEVEEESEAIEEESAEQKEENKPFTGFQVFETPQIIIQPYGNPRVLDEVLPHYIVLYDPNVGIIRQVEVYQALMPKLKLKIYFLLYEESVEEQQYLSSLRKENQAFDSLIRNREVGFPFSLPPLPLSTHRV